MLEKNNAIYLERIAHGSMTAEGIKYHHLFLLCGAQCSLLGLTRLSQIDLPKLDRVENDEPLVILGTSRDTLIVTKPVMLELAPMQIRQTADQVKAHFSVVEIPHNPLYETVTGT